MAGFSLLILLILFPEWAMDLGKDRGLTGEGWKRRKCRILERVLSERKAGKGLAYKALEGD